MVIFFSFLVFALFCLSSLSHFFPFQISFSSSYFILSFSPSFVVILSSFNFYIIRPFLPLHIFSFSYPFPFTFSFPHLFRSRPVIPSDFTRLSFLHHFHSLIHVTLSHYLQLSPNLFLPLLQFCFFSPYHYIIRTITRNNM